MLFSFIYYHKVENMNNSKTIPGSFLDCYRSCRETRNCYSFINQDGKCYKYSKVTEKDSLNDKNIICNKTMDPDWNDQSDLERKKLSYNVCQSKKWKYPKYYYLYNNILYQVSSGENINNITKVDMF
jgi:hypothetical protein